MFNSLGRRSPSEHLLPNVGALRVRRSGRRRLLPAVLLAILLPTARAGGQTPDLFGRPVTSVAFTSDGAVEQEEIGRLVEIRVGKPLTEDATGGTIRNLFATRRFSDVRIEGETSPGGVAVTVHLFRAFRVFPLKFRGAPLPREELGRAIPFSEGSVFQTAQLDEGAAAIKRRLEEEGYLQAQITPEVSFDRLTFDAAVEYRIEAGKPARVAPPFFDGNTAPFTPGELARHARLDPGDRYRESRARADAARMTEFLHRNSRLKGLIELIAAQPTEDGRLMPVYRTFVGPRVVFESRGISPKTVSSEVHDLIEGQIFDEDLILQYVDNKRKELQQKGYYRAKVDYKIAQTPALDTVTVTVDRGAHVEIEKIAFAGNVSVSDAQLRRLMLTRKRGIPYLRPGHLVEEDLTDDLSAILGYYQTHGWVSAKVGKPKITEGSRPDRLVVTLPIEEGPLAIVASREITGAEHADSKVIARELLVKVGEPFNPNAVRQDVYTLQSYYHDHGWFEASVRDDFTLSADKTSADVVYRVDEGLRSFFGKTIVRGNTRTDTSRIRRLVTWREGRPFSETAMLETERNLSRTGVFRRAEVRAQTPDPATQARNVNIDLQEGRPLAVLYGVGYQYAENVIQNRSDPFAVAGISYNNLFGRMLSAGLEGQVALSGRFRLQLSFRDPFLFDRDLRFTSLLFATREPIQDVDLDRFAWVNEVARYFGRYLRVALRAEYQRIQPVNPGALSDIERKNFPRFDQPIEEATLGPNFLYDRRDDVIDPHRGYYATGGVKYAFPLLTAKARYTKVSSQAVYFHPVSTSVITVSARAGGIFPYGPSTIQVPIAERFFAGGASSDRGFSTDLLGIPQRTVDYNTRATPNASGDGSCKGSFSFPSRADYDCDGGPRIVGGNGFLAFNAEFRFSIAGNFGGVVFYDVAQVWTNFSDIRLKLEGPDGLRQGVGVGLRYMTPIGPARLEYGFPVHRRTIPFNVTFTDKANNTTVLDSGTVREKGRFFFALGYPF